MSIQKTSIDFRLSIQIEKIFQGLSLEKSSIEKGIAMIFSAVVAAERILVSRELPASFPTFLSPH